MLTDEQLERASRLDNKIELLRVMEVLSWLFAYSGVSFVFFIVLGFLGLVCPEPTSIFIWFLEIPVTVGVAISLRRKRQALDKVAMSLTFDE